MKKVRVVVEGILQKDKTKMIACKISDEYSQVSLLLSHATVSFKRSDVLFSKHKVEKIPVKLWMSNSFLAS